MKTTQLVLVSSLALLTGACGGRPDLAAERAAIMEADKAWLSAVESKDVDRAVSFWAEDAAVFPPDQAAVVGKNAIRQFVTDSFQMPGFSIRWQTTDVTVSSAGDLAYAVGTNETTLSGPDGKPMMILGKGITVWRKERDGAWKCVIDIWNSAAPPKPTSAPLP